MAAFSCYTPTKIFFGSGCLSNLDRIIPNKSKVFLMTGKTSGKLSGGLDKCASILQDHECEYRVYDKIEPEPLDEHAYKPFRENRTFCPDVIVAVGGGSVIDISKALAILYGNQEVDLASIEGEPVLSRTSTIVAIPTTAGSGSEVTKYSVLTNPDTRRKYTIKSESIIPDYALVDPVMTYSTSQQMIATSGFDAFTHCVEVLLNKQECNPFYTTLASYALKLIADNLVESYRGGPNDNIYKEKMSLASLIGGICISNVRTGLSHTLAAALSSKISLAHGATLAITLPHAIAFNFPYAEREMKNILSIIDPNLKDMKLGSYVTNLVTRIGLKYDLSGRINKEQVDSMADRVMQDTGLSAANPRNFTKVDIKKIFEEMIST